MKCSCRQSVRFGERDGEGLAISDCTSNVESRQTTQVVGIAHWQHMIAGNAEVYTAVGHRLRLRLHLILWVWVVDTRRSCHQLSASQPRIAWFWTGSCLCSPAATSSRARRPPPPSSKCHSIETALALVRIRHRLACTSNPAS